MYCFLLLGADNHDATYVPILTDINDKTSASSNFRGAYETCVTKAFSVKTVVEIYTTPHAMTQNSGVIEAIKHRIKTRSHFCLSQKFREVKIKKLKRSHSKSRLKWGNSF